jgi:hypothetical protein
MQAKTVELERLKRENPSPKELEKVETKFRQRQLNIPRKKATLDLILPFKGTVSRNGFSF